MVTESCCARWGGSHGPQRGPLNRAAGLQLCTPSPVSITRATVKSSKDIRPCQSPCLYSPVVFHYEWDENPSLSAGSAGLLSMPWWAHPWAYNIGLPCLPALGWFGQCKASMGTLGHAGECRDGFPPASSLLVHSQELLPPLTHLPSPALAYCINPCFS